MRRVRAGAVVAISAAVLGVVAPEPAGADCAGWPSVEASLEAADVVAVGTVVELENRDTWATVAVSEVWKGDAALDDRGEVRVYGGPAPVEGGETFVATSVDRAFVLGETYLFAVSVEPLPGASMPEDGLYDTTCSGTAVWSDGLERYRPAAAEPVERSGPVEVRETTDEAPATTDDDPPYVLIVAGVVGIAGACLYLLFRRGSIADRARS